MYCGACLRDNALVTALRRMGHSVVMAPLYLPLTLDEEDQTAGSPVFFSGINVYLDQQSALFSSRPLLAASVAGRAPTARNGFRGRWPDKRRGPGRPDSLHVARGRRKPGTGVGRFNRLASRGKTCRGLPLQRPPVRLARRMRAELRLPVVCTCREKTFFLTRCPNRIAARLGGPWPNGPRTWICSSLPAAILPRSWQSACNCRPRGSGSSPTGSTWMATTAPRQPVPNPDRRCWDISPACAAKRAWTNWWKLLFA